MDSESSRLLTLIEARQKAGRRCVSLMFAAAMNKFTTQTVNEADMDEVAAAADEWHAASQAAAEPAG